MILFLAIISSQQLLMLTLVLQCFTQDLSRPKFDWSGVFEPFPYAKKYTRFLKICLSASDRDELGDWVGWVKSRFRFLLVKVSSSLLKP